VIDSSNSIICLSGAFDPLHVGHVRLIKAATFFGKVVIILNSDKWTFEQKGYSLMPFEQRKEILLSLKDVHSVSSVDDSDGTVCKALLEIKPNIFGNGGSRGKKNTPERKLCLEHGIKMVYGLGGGEKEQISLDIKEKIKNIR
jgi:D-beta-D-heptose 7-phosphate kinase/D-beta-D-heptose 1-phosphate adenosyltransferase